MKVVYQAMFLFLFFSCAVKNVSYRITPKTQFEIACFDVSMTDGSRYDVFVINFVKTGDVWVWWAKDSDGKMGFNPIYRVDYGFEYYMPYSIRGGFAEQSAKDFVVDLFTKYTDGIDKIKRFW